MVDVAEVPAIRMRTTLTFTASGLAEYKYAVGGERWAGDAGGGAGVRVSLSNPPEDTPLEMLAYVGGSRWHIETEFETEKSDVGLDEYETRTWAGWHHHIALRLLGGAILLSMQQDWGKRCPGPPGRRACPRVNGGVPGGAGDAAQGTVRAR